MYLKSQCELIVVAGVFPPYVTFSMRHKPVWELHIFRPEEGTADVNALTSAAVELVSDFCWRQPLLQSQVPLPVSPSNDEDSSSVNEEDVEFVDEYTGQLDFLQQLQSKELDR